MEQQLQTVVAWRDALAAGQVSSQTLAQRLIERVEQAAALNAYVEFDAPGLLEQARRADQRLAAGERLPLLGVPIAVKDNIEALGFACGNGTRALHGLPVQRDAALVQRLRAAGALIAGKTGMHELAFGVTSNNAVTGAVRNPWHHEYSPGGSSGGSGAVVAAGLAPAAIGTDTGGSIRIPAAFCGLAGLRPSLGRVSNAGVAPIAALRDVAGPLATDVADLVLLDTVLTGATALPEVDLAALRLGVPDAFWADLDPGVEQVAQTALAQLRDAGVTLVPLHFGALADINVTANFAEVLAEFQRDMPVYLQSRGGPDFETLLAQVGSPDVQAIVEHVRHGAVMSAEALQLAADVRRSLQASYRDVFAAARIDALVFPTVPCKPPRIGQDETLWCNGQALPVFPTITRNTDPGSNAGLPGLSLPVGVSEGLPVGLEFDALPGQDRHLLALGMALASVLNAPPVPGWRAA